MKNGSVVVSIFLSRMMGYSSSAVVKSILFIIFSPRVCVCVSVFLCVSVCVFMHVHVCLHACVGVCVCFWVGRFIRVKA